MQKQPITKESSNKEEIIGSETVFAKIFFGFGVVDEKLREDLHPWPTDGLFLD